MPLPQKKFSKLEMGKDKFQNVAVKFFIKINGVAPQKISATQKSLRVLS